VHLKSLALGSARAKIEVTESDRQDGVLAVRVRFRNTGEQPVKLSLVDSQGYRQHEISPAERHLGQGSGDSPRWRRLAAAHH